MGVVPFGERPVIRGGVSVTALRALTISPVTGFPLVSGVASPVPMTRRLRATGLLSKPENSPTASAAVPVTCGADIEIPERYSSESGGVPMVPSDAALSPTGLRPSWKKGMAKGGLVSSWRSPANVEPGSPSKVLVK